METIYLLIPLSILLVLLIVWVFFWSVKNNQFDDLQGAGYRILFDDDDNPSNANKSNQDASEANTTPKPKP